MYYFPRLTKCTLLSVHRIPRELLIVALIYLLWPTTIILQPLHQNSTRLVRIKTKELQDRAADVNCHNVLPPKRDCTSGIYLISRHFIYQLAKSFFKAGRGNHIISDTTQNKNITNLNKNTRNTWKPLGLGKQWQRGEHQRFKMGFSRSFCFGCPAGEWGWE